MQATVGDLKADEGTSFVCPCRTHAFGKRELINAFGADMPLENIGLRYRYSQCDTPAHGAWLTKRARRHAEAQQRLTA